MYNPPTARAEAQAPSAPSLFENLVALQARKTRLVTRSAASDFFTTRRLSEVKARLKLGAESRELFTTFPGFGLLW